MKRILYLLGLISVIVGIWWYINTFKVLKTVTIENNISKNKEQNVSKNIYNVVKKEKRKKIVVQLKKSDLNQTTTKFIKLTNKIIIKNLTPRHLFCQTSKKSFSIVPLIS